MKANVKKLKDCKVRMTVEVEAKLVEDRFQEVLRDIRRVATLPGFREGKAPSDLVEKKYADEAREEVLKSLIPEVYHQMVAQHKLAPVALPSISDIQLERGKSLTFAAEFERHPDFSFKNYKGIRIEKIPVEVREDDVEKGIQSLVESRAELEPVLEPRAVQKGDFIVADIEIWQNEQYRQGRAGVLLHVEPNQHDDFFDKICGANVNDAREITAPPTAAESQKGLVGAQPHYRITVRAIQAKRLPELNDAFAQAFGKTGVEELREAVRKDLSGYKQQESYEKMKKELFDRLLTMAQFELPEGLVARQKEELLEQARRRFERAGLQGDALKSELARTEADAGDKARQQVKLYFLLQRVADQEKIEVDEIQLEQRLTALAAEAEKPIEEARRVFEEDLRHSLREARTVEFLLANAKLEEPKTKS